ncbi:hypothetical protein TrRE_jg10338, partial [Triparma retinervis]
DGGDVADLDEINTHIMGVVKKAFEGGGHGTVEGDWGGHVEPRLAPGLPVITKKAVAEICTPKVAMSSAVEAFTSLSDGSVTSPVPLQISFPGLGSACIKPGWVHSSPYYVVKVASSFPQNASLRIPTGTGCVLVLSARTGGPVALLKDEGHMTDVRTAAAAGGDITVGVVGGGAVAKLVGVMCGEIGGVALVKCWSRSSGTKEDFKRAVAPEIPTAQVQIVGSVKDAVRDCDVVFTVTPSTTPLVEEAGWIKEGAVVVAVGSDTPGKRELGEGLLERVRGGVERNDGSSMICDTVENVIKLGEFQYLHPASHSSLVTLGDVITGKKTIERGKGVKIVDLTGAGAQDAAIAGKVMEKWDNKVE